MQLTLPPLLGRVDKSLLALRVTVKETVDRRPLTGATMLVWETRATAAVEAIIEEAMATLNSVLSQLGRSLRDFFSRINKAPRVDRSPRNCPNSMCIDKD